MPLYFLKADPELKTRVQVMPDGSASRRARSGMGKLGRDTEARPECDLGTQSLPAGDSGMNLECPGDLTGPAEGQHTGRRLPRPTDQVPDPPVPPLLSSTRGENLAANPEERRGLTDGNYLPMAGCLPRCTGCLDVPGLPLETCPPPPPECPSEPSADVDTEPHGPSRKPAPPLPALPTLTRRLVLILRLPQAARGLAFFPEFLIPPSSSALWCSPVRGDGGVEEGGAEEGRDQASAPTSPGAEGPLPSAASSQKVRL
ncbi:unnamed protein product [Rangifer tarandus platyrhynchus]|uniref:Uncharacterized protein n=1 Tax=Rangifer tarandus platyrhynchus TaxID=3082113 RepID=A0AC59Z1G2_RANTA